MFISTSDLCNLATEVVLNAHIYIAAITHLSAALAGSQ